MSYAGGRSSVCGVERRGGLPRLLAVLCRLHREVDDTRRRQRRRRADGGLLVEEQRLFEADVADLGGIAEHGVRRRQRHLAVRGAGKHGHVADLVVVEPRLGGGADLALPHVALRLLLQAHVFDPAAG